MTRNLIIDQTMLQNRNEVLAYTGDVDGQYVNQIGTKVTVGTYECALPFITDALFTPKYEVNYGTDQQAQEAALAACGKAAVLGMLFGEVYVTYIKRQDGLWKRTENGALVPVNAAKN